MAGRPSRGRQRIPIQRIASQDDLYASFSKRRIGLYKKASELCTLCGVDIGIIIFSPKNNPYSFFHPSMDSVLRRHRNPAHPPDHVARLVDTQTRNRIEELNRRLDEVLAQKEQEIEKGKALDGKNRNREKGWWETPLESLSPEHVKEWMDWFQELYNSAGARMEELRNGASSSSAIVPQPGNLPDYSAPVMFGSSSVPHEILGGTSSFVVPHGMDGGGMNTGGYHLPSSHNFGGFHGSGQGMDPFGAGPSSSSPYDHHLGFYPPATGDVFAPGGSGSGGFEVGSSFTFPDAFGHAGGSGSGNGSGGAGPSHQRDGN